jgi:TonB family protein
VNRTLFVLVVCLAVASIGAIAQDVSSPQPTRPADQVQLGNEYLAQKDYSMAMTWFRKAADQGNATARNNVGWLYQNGWGVKQDYVEAMAWYRKAADQGNPTAQVSLGWLYRKGYGVERDYAQAMAWFRKAADQDNAQARANIGWLYEKGLGVKQDYAEAMLWYRKAADQGNTDAQNDIGGLYQNGLGVKQDYSEALTRYLGAADKGNADAQNSLGWLYEKGFGVDQDYAQAMAWYYRAADQGNAAAQCNLGWLYRKGLGVSPDYAKAMIWFRKAADQGDIKAPANIGWLYENGVGVPQDYVEAMTWYRKAAAQGNADAQNNIGELYRRGLGVSQDYAEAMTWYRKAAEGNADAQNNIGWLYQNGLGVKQDDAEAMTWYRKAAEQGNARAKANIEALSQVHGTIQSVASTLTASEKGNPPRVLMPGGIVAPRSVSAPDPEYSDEARKAHLEGTSVLKLIVDTEGKPRDIKVFVPLGSGLDEKAVDAIKTWKFEPATKDGKPVAVQIMIEVNFHLYGSWGVGKVEVVGDPQGVNSASFLSPIVIKAGKCLSKLTDDKTHPPSIGQGLVTVQFVLNKDGRVGAAEIASASGDDLLDRAARDCVSPLKVDAPLPVEFKGTDLTVRMQLLYNMSMSLTPSHPQIAVGGREQFYIELAGTMSKTADWSVTGVDCGDAACGTISPDGLYNAPNVLPQSPFVRVKGTLPGANPIAATALVTLLEKH